MLLEVLLFEKESWQVGEKKLPGGVDSSKRDFRFGSEGSWNGEVVLRGRDVQKWKSPPWGV